MDWRSFLCGIAGTAGFYFSKPAPSIPTVPAVAFVTGKTLLFQTYANAVGTAAHYSVLINEFLADPDPPAGLPKASFIELKNVSAIAVSLKGWSIGNGKSSAVIHDDIILKPDSLIAFCPGPAAADYSGYGNTVALKGFPALGHLSGQVVLAGPEEEVVDAVAYDRDSYHDPVKAEGGWSLERIDATKPCLGGSNWTASTDVKGGTPGSINSANGTAVNSGNQSASSVVFDRGYCPDSTHIMLLLDGPVDAAPANDPAYYRIEPGDNTVTVSESLPPFFDRILLTMKNPVTRGQIFQIGTSALSSCDVPVTDAIIRIGLADAADSGDILFNEILFNPPSFGSDYIELYCSGKKIIDLQQCQLASRDGSGAVKEPKPITTIPWLLFPQDYLVVTENRSWVLTHYLVKTPAQLLELSQMPSMPDDKGTVVLLSSSGLPIDELPYDHRWHSPLIADESGVALEKTGLKLRSAAAGSWTSAASTAGFGTPTYVNSESDASGYDSGRSKVAVEPVVFSPDNDGYNDFCFITLRPNQPGFTAKILIYDINGICVKTLAAGATPGAEGKFRWDGFDDEGNSLASGRYVIFTEIFSLTGSVYRFKNVVVLARNRRH